MPDLPKDPAMLLSVVNMYLRDRYDGSLEAMCDDWGVSVTEIEELMRAAGWEYNSETGRFW